MRERGRRDEGGGNRNRNRSNVLLKKKKKIIARICNIMANNIIMISLLSWWSAGEPLS